MQDGNFVAENLMQVGGDRRREPDFGNEQNGGASCFEHGTHPRKVYGRFSRAGDTVQQDAGELSRIHRFPQAIQSSPLRWIEIEFHARPRGLLRETANAAGSSIISIRLRLTSVRKVVRGISSACSVSTGTWPPDAARVSISWR